MAYRTSALPKAPPQLPRRARPPRCHHKHRRFIYEGVVPRRPRQLSLELQPRRRRGGRRAGAGRKPTPHRRRAAFAATHPSHVTLRVRTDVPSLRSAKLVSALERSFSQACDRGDFRLIHYSLQGNHVHLLVEATDRSSLARGMKAIGARLARAANRVFGRSGPVLTDHYHAHALKTARELRNALRYVLLNARRHAKKLRGAAGLDPASSARWFDGWRRAREATPQISDNIPRHPVARARTWLLRVGWRRHGLIDPGDVPGPARSGPSGC